MDQFTLSPIKAIELEAAKIPGSVSLAQGIPSFRTPEVITEFVIEKVRAGLCDRYSLTTGVAELREEIAASLAREGLRYDPEREIIVTAGSIEGISAALLALIEPGDEVLIPSPAYASYTGAIYLARGVPKFFPLDEEHNFDFKVEALEAAITKRTKVILYSSPNNPTGTAFSEDKTRAIAELAERRGIYLLIDEVYKEFYYLDFKHFSPAAIESVRDRVIRVCSFSKSFAMTGWRVGFLHCAAGLCARILKYHDAMVTCAPVASQYAAIAALRFGDEALREFQEHFRRRRSYAVSRLDALSHIFDYQTPVAAYFVFPRVKDTVALAQDSTALAYDILRKQRVALVPGVAFGPTGESHLRITFSRELEELQLGFDRLEEYFHAASRTRASGVAASGAARPRLGMMQRAMRGTLATAARLCLAREKPTIIGIIGTRGKTVVKRALAERLASVAPTRATLLSHNTEVGLPLSVLGVDFRRSLHTKTEAARRIISRILTRDRNTRFLVLEFGVLTPDDAQCLLQIAKPDWLVITDLEPADPHLSHADFISAAEAVAAAVPPQRIIWPADDRFAGALRKQLTSELAVAADAQGPVGAGRYANFADAAAKLLLTRIV